MIALLSLNQNSKEIECKNDEDLLMYAKDYFINDLDDSIDELNEQIHGFIDTDECLVDLQEQVDALERKSERLQRADDLNEVKRLGYDVTILN